MSYDQKPARMRVIDGSAAVGTPRRSEAAAPLDGSFGSGPGPRPAKSRATASDPLLGRGMIALLFLSAALIGGVVQAWLLLRP